MVFLTHAWSNITSSVRQAKPPAGTASVYKIWQRCRHHGIETHVFIVSADGDAEPREFEALEGVHFHWLQPFAHRLVTWLTRRKLGVLLYWTKAIDWVRLFFICRHHCRDAQAYYSMRWGLAPVAYLMARMAGGVSIVRHYGTFIYDEWTRGSWLGKLSTVSNAVVMKFPVDLQIMTNDGTRGDQVFETMRVSQHSTKFWLNGINKDMKLSNFDASEAKQLLSPGISPDTLILMCVGRLSYWKRQDLIIKALPEILQQVPTAKLLLVGSGECEQDLRELCSEVAVEHAVVFCGAVANSQLPTYLNCADIYLQVNDVSNVSTTLIEALSAGCCCVARNEGGMDAIIDNGHNARLIEGNNPSDIASVCIELLLNPNMREELRERAWHDAQQRFHTWDQRMDMELETIGALVKPASH